MCPCVLCVSVCVHLCAYLSVCHTEGDEMLLSAPFLMTFATKGSTRKIQEGKIINGRLRDIYIDIDTEYLFSVEYT